MGLRQLLLTSRLSSQNKTKLRFTAALVSRFAKMAELKNARPIEARTTVMRPKIN